MIALGCGMAVFRMTPLGTSENCNNVVFGSTDEMR